MCTRTLQRRRFDHVTTILTADKQAERGTTEILPDLHDTVEHTDVSGEYKPCLLVSISGEPLDSDVAVTSRRDTEEFQTDQVPGSRDLDADVMHSRGAVFESMASRGRNHQTANISEDRRLADFTGSNDVDQKLQRKAVSADTKPRHVTRTVDDKPKSSRVCDECRAGLSRKSTTSKDKTTRWNSPASQQSTATNQRTTKSTVRPSQNSLCDQTARTNRSNFAKKEDTKTSSVSSSWNTVNYSSQRTVNNKQARCDDRATCSPTSTKNRAADSATSCRRDVTSGHVTRRSLSAKTASSVTQVPGRRCQSSDDRIQRQKNLSTNQESTQAPFHRKCCCATRNYQGQGRQLTSEGQAGSCSRPSERRALPDGVSKPWARTLRDYGGSDKSPSPVRSRRSTPESTNCPRISTRTTKTGCEAITKQDLPANRRSRPIPGDIGTTKSDSTLVQKRPDKKITSTSSLTISLSSPPVTVTPRCVLNVATSRNTASERRTPTTPPRKQRADRTANSNRVGSISSRVPCTEPNRRRTEVSATQKGPKPLASSTISSSRNTVKTVDYDFCDLENSPSRAPAVTSIQPEVIQRTCVRRRSRLTENCDISSTPLIAVKPAQQRSRVSDADDMCDKVGNLSATNQGDTKTSNVNPSHVTSSMTSLTAHRNLELDQRKVGNSAGEDAEKKSSLTTNSVRTSTSCSQREQLEKTRNTKITNFVSDGFLRQPSVTSIDIGEENCLLSHHSSSSSTTVASSFQVNRSTSGKENVADTGGNIQEQKCSDNFQDNTITNGNMSVTQKRERQSKAKLRSGQLKKKETDNKKILSVFDELEIERDFQFVDEILSCTTADHHRLIAPADCHFSCLLYTSPSPRD